MVLNLQDKQVIITEVSKVAKDALSAIVADYRGITVEKITKLRQAGREANVYIRIIRNTLIRRVVKGTHFECLNNKFIGPTLIAFSHEHPGSAARLFKEFAKENSNFKVKGAAFEGKVLSTLQLDYLATLPTYKEAIIRLMLTIKEASVSKLIRTLLALRDQKAIT